MSTDIIQCRELHVQKYLRSGKTLEDLSTEFAIIVNKHLNEPLIILNYDQIESLKTHMIPRECRGLVLNLNNFDIIAKSFDRFFNWGEVLDEQDKFDFSNFVVEEKVDGSLVLIYSFDGKIHINTRGSFGLLELEDSGKPWGEMIKAAIGTESFSLITKLIKNTKITLVCEYCSLYNKIVRTYNTPKVYLLSVFDFGKEYDWNEVDNIGIQLNLPRPVRYEFKSIEQIEKFIREIGDTDKTFEGVVIRDIKGNRWKIKNPTYLALHRMKGNSNCFPAKNLVPFVLSGESGELLAIYPEVKEKYDEVSKIINDAFDILCKVFHDSREIEDQKTFALSILKKTPFTGILFHLKKSLEKKATVADLKTIWRNSEENILKVLF